MCSAIGLILQMRCLVWQPFYTHGGKKGAHGWYNPGQDPFFNGRGNSWGFSYEQTNLPLQILSIILGIQMVQQKLKCMELQWTKGRCPSCILCESETEFPSLFCIYLSHQVRYLPGIVAYFVSWFEYHLCFPNKRQCYVLGSAALCSSFQVFCTFCHVVTPDGITGPAFMGV